MLAPRFSGPHARGSAVAEDRGRLTATAFTDPSFPYQGFSGSAVECGGCVEVVLGVPDHSSELACRSNTTLSSASQHATVLRNAGLVTTQRYGGAVLHSLTPLGLALLNDAP